MTHTPGPWNYDECRLIHGDTGNIVADPHRGDTPYHEQTANAVLMAQSPSLLLALERLEGAVSRLLDHDGIEMDGLKADTMFAREIILKTKARS